MSLIPQVRSVMTLDPITVPHSATVREAQLILSEKGFRHLPVTMNGEVISVLSDRDINLALIAHINMGAEDLIVEDVCILNVFTVSPEMPLDQVVLEMAERHIGSALVVEGGRLVGIFTATDACRYLARCLQGNL